MAGPAWSQTYVGVPPPVVKSDQIVRTDAPEPPPAARSGLAFTGADIAELVGIGAFGAAAGALSLRLGRKRPEMASPDARSAGAKPA